MKVALKGSNGLYIAAEEGGGIDTRLQTGKVALRANRAEIGPWETFEIEKVDEVHIAIKTCDGFYVTAEGGGGSYLRTNEKTRGVWETFAWISNGQGQHALFVTHDMLHVVAVKYHWNDPIVTATTTWNGLTVEVLEQPRPPMPNTRLWKGLFCMPRALPGIPYGDGKRVWTPAYGCYDEGWRANIRAAYKERGYTHFVYNAAGLPYADDYPELADDSQRVERDLTELLNAGLVPVVCCTDDRNPKVVLQSVINNAPLIPVCFPVWEMNGPLGDPDKAVEEQNCKDIITKVRNALPLAECYLHFTPGHGSISYASEMGGWEWCQANGTTGLLAQGSNKFAEEDPKTGGEGLESTAVRLAGLVDQGAPEGWRGMNQLTVKFEYGIYDMYYNDTVSEEQLCEYTMEFLSYAPNVVGYCDGGY